MYNLKSLNLKDNQSILMFWVKLFMTKIVAAALPLRAISEEKYLDGVSHGIAFVIENVSGRGTFDASKGNIVNWMEKSLVGLRQDARKEAEAHVTSLDKLLAAVGDDAVIGLDDYEAENPANIVEDDFALEFANFIRSNTEAVVKDPSPDAIKYGELENDRILFTTPGETLCPVVYSKQTTFKMVDGKPVEDVTVLKCVSAMPKGQGSSYADEEMDESNGAVWRTMLVDGELVTDYEADDRHEPDEENDFPEFLADYAGKFSAKALAEIGEWAPAGKLHYRGAFITPKRKTNDKPEEVSGDVELLTPTDLELESILNPYVAPTQEQLRKALELYELQADGVRHLAYCEWKGVDPVVVTGLNFKKRGFNTESGGFISLGVAQGIAAFVKPASGDVVGMLKAVRESFPGNVNAEKFVRRIEGVHALVLY